MSDRPREHDVPGPAAQASTGRPPAPPPPEPSHAERCRTLVASASRGALSTIAADPAGYPYGSVATYGLDDRGNPLFFVSLMAEHTQNAIRDPRASLLVTEPVPEGADPLASGRATLMGRLSAVDDTDRPAVQERYLAANPTAAYYIGFGDFAFYRLDVEAIRYVGGYGRMSWVDAGAYAVAEPDPLAPFAAGIIGHMNADHGEAQVLYCRHLAGYPDTVAATMSAVDRYGFEMVAEGPSGPSSGTEGPSGPSSGTEGPSGPSSGTEGPGRRTAVRLGFPEPCTTPDEVRQAMVAMVREARLRYRQAEPQRKAER